LLAAGVLIDLERIGRSERLALVRLDDSKQKTPEEREELYPQVIRAAACVSVAVRSPHRIDCDGLHVSNLAALTDCMNAVAQDQATRLVDGFRLPRCELEHTPVVDGDARSAAIAAASVIAKVTRDRYMRRVAELYPDWNFEGNVGYSTPEHREAIMRHGICALHRRSFASVAYSQLDFGGGAPGSEAEEAAPLSEGTADVIDIMEAIRAEADPDDVEAIARDA
jgi:ribonuclease HII